MGTRDGNPTWQDYPSTATVINAARLNAIEAAIDDSADVSDAVPLATSTPLADAPTGSAGTAATAAHGDHQHPQLNLGWYPVPPSVSGIHFTPVGGQDSLDIYNAKCPGTPLPVPRPFTISEIAFRMQSAADGGNWKLAIYSSNTYGLPWGAPVWTSAAQSSLTAGTKSISALSVSLSTAGMYWLFFGSYGFTTNRGRPGQSRSPQVTISLLPQVLQGGLSGLFLNGFNETTGAFPTLSSYDYVGHTDAFSGWGYGLTGDLL